MGSFLLRQPARRGLCNLQGQAPDPGCFAGCGGCTAQPPKHHPPGGYAAPNLAVGEDRPCSIPGCGQGYVKDLAACPPLFPFSMSDSDHL